MPATDVSLPPAPSEKAIYLIDSDKGELSKIESGGPIMPSGKGMGHNFRIETSEWSNVKPGKASFIDNTGRNMALVKLDGASGPFFGFACNKRLDEEGTGRLSDSLARYGDKEWVAR